MCVGVRSSHLHLAQVPSAVSCQAEMGAGQSPLCGLPAALEQGSSLAAWRGWTLLLSLNSEVSPRP